MQKPIEIIDALCGTGKTTAIISWMHKNPTNRYLYVSPLVKEIEERIVEECEELGFVYPENDGARNKSQHLLELLEEGQNVAFTHNLYSRLTQAHMDAIELQGYVLIIDEEVTMIEPLERSGSGSEGYTNQDLKYLYNDGKLLVDTEDFGRLVWNWEGYEDNAKYSRLKAMCNLGMVYCADFKKDKKTGEKVDEIHSLVTQLPIELLKCCKRTILISYLFEGSIMDSFLEMKGVETRPFDMEAEGVELRWTNSEIKQQIAPLIDFVETRSTKRVGRKRLTYTWYQNEFTNETARQIGGTIRSVGAKAKAKPEDMMWTAPKDRTTLVSKGNRIKIKPQGYSAENCYVFPSARATNDYAHKRTLVHCLYRHPNLTVEQYLKHYGVEVNTDNFATAELIQWVWRSRIRNKEPISLCILSKRMDILFKDWLNKMDN